MSTGRIVFKNFVSLTFSNSISKVAGLFTVVYLARVLGPQEFGKMNFALALISYFSILASLGLGTIGARELAQRQGDPAACINRILSLRLLLGAGAFLLLAVFLFFLKEDPGVKQLALVYGLTMFTANVLPFDWVFQGIEKMEYLGLSSTLQGLAYLGLILLVVKGSPDLFLIPWILLAAQACSVIFMFFAYRRLFPAFRPAFTPPSSWNMLRQAMPVAAWGVLTVVTLNSGITILGFMKTPEEVGYFSAAYKIVWIITEILLAYVASVFPTMAKHHALNPEKYTEIIDRTVKWGTILTFPAIAGLCVLSVPITALIYSSKFADAAAILALLAALPYLIFLTSLFSHALIAAHHQGKALKITAIQAALIVALNLALIPAYGAKGVAAAALIATALSNYLCRLEAGRFIRLEKYRPVKPLLASGVMALALWPATGLSLLLTIPLGAAVYAAAILALKGIPGEDLAALKGALGLGDRT